KLSLRQAIDFIDEAWEDIKNSEPSESELGGTELDESELGENMLGENELGRSELDKSELEAIEPDIPKVDDIDILIDDLSVDNSPKVQQLIQDIEEYSYLIDQPVITEDIFTDEGIIEIVKHNFEDNKAVEVLKKVIRYQEGLEAEKGFDEDGLK
ncbi:35636_t:CDS:2, partial [Racocetra persica]